MFSRFDTRAHEEHGRDSAALVKNLVETKIRHLGTEGASIYFADILIRDLNPLFTLIVDAVVLELSPAAARQGDRELEHVARMFEIVAKHRASLVAAYNDEIARYAGQS